MSLGLLAVLVVLAMLAGLVVGRAAYRSLPGEVGGRSDDGGESIGGRARSAATSAAFRLWKWRRNRDDG